MFHRRQVLAGSMGAGLLAFASGCATAAAAPPTRDILRQTIGEGEQGIGMIAVLVDEGGAHMTTYGSSGAPGVALNGDTVFEIGSITKVMTTLMLADMAGRGEVAFDDPVAKYLPPSVTLHERGRPITLLDLATYTSGLPNQPGNFRPPLSSYTVDRLFEFLSAYVPNVEPGAHYEYANLGFGLLGVALARRAGKSFEELLIERVCDPLGLDHTRITLTDDMRRGLAQSHDRDRKPTPLLDLPASLQGAGAVRSNARDLTVFLKACMGLERSPLTASFARLLETRRRTTLAGTDVGLGWFVSSNQSDEIVWKSGVTDGFKAFVAFSKRSRRGALVLSNVLWKPIDDDLGMKLIDPDFDPGDLNLLYR